MRLIRRKNRQLKYFRYKGTSNSLSQWWRIKNPFRVMLNYLVISICKWLPSLRLKRLMYRAIGMRIGKGVSIGLGAMFDIFFPELIEIGDNTVIGYNATFIAHEFLVKEWRTGKVKIGKNVMIGAGAMVLAGVSIGDNATVSAMSLVNRDVRPRTFVEGVPAKVVKK